MDDEFGFFGLYAYDTQTNSYYWAHTPAPNQMSYFEFFEQLRIFLSGALSDTVAFPKLVFTKIADAPQSAKDLLESYQLTNNSASTQFIDLILPEDKDSSVQPLSLYDGALVGTSTAGIILFVLGTAASTVLAGPILFASGAVGLYNRRGPAAAFAVPLGIAAAFTHPIIAARAIGETVRSTIQVVKATADTSIQIIGLAVTVSGVVLGLVWGNQFPHTPS